MRIILALSLLLSACACVGSPLISITGGSSGGGKLDPGATNAVLEASYAYTDNASLESLQSSKTYSDTNTLVRSKSYTDFAAFSVISDLQTYANTVAASSLTSAKLYSDTNTLFRANNYTDSIGFGIESSAAATARGYCADTLSASKLYSQTNTLLEAKNFAGSQDVVVLSQARQYADNAASTKLPKSGGTMTGNINMNTHSVIGVADPVNGQDAATKQYVDDSFYHAKLYSDTNTLVRSKAYIDSVVASATNNFKNKLFGLISAIPLFYETSPGSGSYSSVPACSLNDPPIIGSEQSPYTEWANLRCGLYGLDTLSMIIEVFVEHPSTNNVTFSYNDSSIAVASNSYEFNFPLRNLPTNETVLRTYIVRVTYTPIGSAYSSYFRNCVVLTYRLRVWVKSDYI